MSKVLLGLLAVTLVMSGRVNADTGLYFGASYGLAELDDTADTGNRRSGGFVSQPASIDGWPFDDDDAFVSGFLGYQAHSHVALEVGYGEVGEFTPGIVFLSGDEPPVIEVENTYLAARLRYPITHSFSATWHVGLVEASFDVEGMLRRGQLILSDGTVIGCGCLVPFAEIDDEVGYRWGFGANWRFAEHASAGIEISRQDLKVFELDTFSLRVMVHI